MEIPSTIFIAIGAVLAAIISGYFAFVNLVASKDQKTSEFRQDWINKLREDITNFTASSASFTSIFIHICEIDDDMEKEAKISDFLNNNVALLDSIIKSYDSIRLRVNPKDDKKFLKKLEILYLLVEKPRLLTSENIITKATDELIVESQVLLKQEWNRVKRGELSFWITKWLSLAILIISVVFISYKYDSISSLFDSYVKENNKQPSKSMHMDCHKRHAFCYRKSPATYGGQ